MIDNTATFKLSYGLFILTAREGEKDSGCIINTVQQLTDKPLQLSVTVNKQNYTHDMILRTGEFNVSVLDETADFSLFQRFGFQSGRDADKFSDFPKFRMENGVVYVARSCNAAFSCKVVQTVDCGTHTLFVAEVTESMVLDKTPSVTYAYYFEHIKPKPQTEKKKGWVCKICGYVYEGDPLPEDFICPLCKHGASDFEPIQ